MVKMLWEMLEDPVVALFAAELAMLAALMIVVWRCW